MKCQMDDTRVVEYPCFKGCPLFGDCLVEYEKTKSEKGAEKNPTSELHGYVVDAKHAYQRKTYVYPKEHFYSEGVKKYTCPVCNAHPHQTNCSLYGVNLQFESVSEK